jgi:hypothetical protein
VVCKKSELIIKMFWVDFWYVFETTGVVGFDESHDFVSY